MATRKVRQTPKVKFLNALAVKMNISPRVARHVLDSVIAVFQNELERTKKGAIRIKVPGQSGLNSPSKILQILDEGPAKKRKSS